MLQSPSSPPPTSLPPVAIPSRGDSPSSDAGIGPPRRGCLQHTDSKPVPPCRLLPLRPRRRPLNLYLHLLRLPVSLNKLVMALTLLVRPFLFSPSSSHRKKSTAAYGACGKNNTESDLIVAVSHSLYDGFQYVTNHTSPLHPC